MDISGLLHINAKMKSNRLGIRQGGEIVSLAENNSSQVYISSRLIGLSDVKCSSRVNVACSTSSVRCSQVLFSRLCVLCYASVPVGGCMKVEHSDIVEGSLIPATPESIYCIIKLCSVSCVGSIYSWPGFYQLVVVDSVYRGQLQLVGLQLHHVQWVPLIVITMVHRKVMTLKAGYDIIRCMAIMGTNQNW